MTSSSRGRFRDKASHIWMGRGNSLARCANTSAMFSPACLRPEKNSAILRPSRVETMPVVKTPVRPGNFWIFHDTVLIDKLENLHRCVIVVEYLAGSGLPDELLKSRLDALCAVAYH